MNHRLKRSALLLPIMLPFALAACVSQSRYDEVVAQNQQLQQQIAADKVHITRLQGAIKYTVNSDLLFAPGSWQISADGKDVIAKMAKVLAPGLQDKLLVNGYTDNSPVGAGLKRQGVTTNLDLSQKRADAVMQFMATQGVNPSLMAAKGYGEADPVATNSTAAGRAQNRRVEVTLAQSAS